MKILNEIKCVFPADSRNEGFARSLAASFSAQLDPSVNEIGEIKTAVSEAVTNCIVHAYRGTSGAIELVIRILDGGILYGQGVGKKLSSKGNVGDHDKKDTVGQS